MTFSLAAGSCGGALLARAGRFAKALAIVTLSFGTVMSGIIAHAQQSGSAATSEINQRTTTMKLKIMPPDKSITATLVDSPTSRDFVSLLPITLTLKDYASHEEISDLPRRLSIEGAPAGNTPSTGDVSYYSPWGNLAIFYKDFRYSSGLIKLGKIDGGLEADESTRVTIELVDKSE
jgi:hypothetical protein